MGRTRVYADRADKQRAYRERIDLSGELSQLRDDLQSMAQEGQTVVIDPVLIDFNEASAREVFRQVVKQVRERVGK